MNLQKELDKLQNKLNEVNSYVSELPTKDEVNEMDQKMNDIRSENEQLKSKLGEMEKKITRAKALCREKVSYIFESMIEV